LYALLRSSYVDSIPTSPSVPPEFLSHLGVVLQAVALYIGLLVFPFDLHVFHRIDPLLSNASVWLGLSLLVVAGWGIRRALVTEHRAVAFAILWFLIGLLPVVHLTGSNVPLLESWVYFASGGFFVLAAAGLARFEKLLPSQANVWLPVLIAILLGGLTLRRTGDWRDEVKISLHTLNASPDDPIALGLLGNAQFRRARVPEAQQLLEKALALAPQDPRIHESLARLYNFLGKESEVAAHYRRMRELAPGDPYVYWRSGRYQLSRKNFVEAEKHFADAVRLFPYSPEIRNDLATVYYIQGKLGAARAELEAALDIAPGSEILKNNLERLDRKEADSSLAVPSQ
jgi:Flp pilus assembly protein TadD